MSNKHSYHEGYMRDQAICKPTDIGTDQKQETLVYVISILNVTRYAAQVNRPKLNEIIDALQKSNKDLNRLFNITEVLTQCIRYQQKYIYMCTILTYLWESLTYMRQIFIHTIDYVHTATTNILSSHILPVDDLRNILRHIGSELPSTMHQSNSSDDTLHFYQYLNIHIFIAEGQFLLLVDGSIQNRAQKLQSYEIFSLPVPYSNLSASIKLTISTQKSHIMKQRQLP